MDFRASRGGGLKKARPRQRRQGDLLRQAPPKPTRAKAPAPTAAYSHIQTITQPEAPEDPQAYGRLTPLSFVKKSLQEEIDEGSVELQPPRPPTAGMAPLSFAQAATTALIRPAASRRITSMESITKTAGDESIASFSAVTNDGHSASSAGGLIKSGKKNEGLAGYQLDTSAQEGAFGVGGRILPRQDAPALSGTKQLQTPTPLYADPTSPNNTSFGHPTARAAYTTVSRLASRGLEPEQERNIIAGYTSPTRSLKLGSPPSHQKSRRYTSGTDNSSIIQKEDSEETKEKLESIMARLDDVFDAEEWDPELLDATSANSPEHFAVEPQRIIYTTVGSVAKTNSVPTFTPPVRIQREGANRRMPILPTMRAADNFFARQQSIAGPGFALPNSNPYMGQQSQQPQSGTSQAGINLSLLESLNLTVTDQEKEVVDTLGYSPASVRSGNIQMPPYPPPMGSFGNEDQYAAERLMKENTYGQNSSLPGSNGLAGLNKMQTLQRLAQFENPAQGFAKERLAEFKAVKMQQQQQSPENGHISRIDFNAMQRQSSFSAMSQFRSENDNPLQSSRRPSYDNIYQHGQYGGGASSVPPGYPQPLTAGPPGQRQNTVSVSRFNWVGAQNNNNNAHPHGLTYATKENSYSPWFRDGFSGYDTHRSDTFRSIPSEDSYIKDTASAVDIQQYYPGGFPMGFQMRQTRSMGERERQRNLLDEDEFRSIERDLMNEVENKRWYDGLDRFGMTVHDLVDEFEMREKPHQPGPIQRPTTEFLAARRAASVADIEKMSLPEVAEPILAAAFGTLVAYADKINRPENRNLMSKFEQSPAWALDTSPEGRESIFGDDWAAPPKRLGRDPRYQPSPLSEVWGNDNQSRFNF